MVGEYPRDFSVAYDKVLWNFSVEAAPQIYHLVRETVSKASRLLDLGCGPGRLCKFFAEMGFCTTGVDLSPWMLEIAKTHCTSIEEQVTWILEDASNFQINMQFDVVTSTFSSINLLANVEEVEKCLAMVYEHLAKGGVFIFDMTTPFGAKLHNSQHIFDSEMYTLLLDGYYDPTEPEKAYLHFLGFYREKGEAYTRFEHRQIETIIDVEEVDRMLRRAGLADVEYYCYGTHSLQPADPSRVANVVVKAHK